MEAGGQLRMSVNLPHQRTKQSGSNLIEVALVLPIFLLLLFAILIYGIAFTTQQIMNYAVDRSAQSVVAIDPALNSDAFAARALNRINSQLASTLGVFQVHSPSVVLINGDCELISSSNSNKRVSFVCIETDPDNFRRRLVTVSLSPSFSSLLPNFPLTGFVPAPEFVHAVGRVVVANDSASGTGS